VRAIYCLDFRTPAAFYLSYVGKVDQNLRTLAFPTMVSAALLRPSFSINRSTTPSTFPFSPSGPICSWAAVVRVSLHQYGGPTYLVLLGQSYAIADQQWSFQEMRCSVCFLWKFSSYKNQERGSCQQSALSPVVLSFNSERSFNDDIDW